MSYKLPIYDKHKEIICYTKIDKKDSERISQYTWRLMGRGYIKAKINKKDVYLHRFILEENDPKIIVDHINNDPLDNRKSNLRKATIAENCFNRTKAKNASSQYKGVSYNKVNKKWAAYIKLDGHKYNLGFFEDEKKASKEYNRFAKVIFGVYAKLNK